VERDNIQCISIAVGTTAHIRSSTPYHPHGAPIFSYRQKAKHAKYKLLHEAHWRNSVKENSKERKNPTLHPFPFCTVVLVM
jgi:hypothetical protein